MARWKRWKRWGGGLARFVFIAHRFRNEGHGQKPWWREHCLIVHSHENVAFFMHPIPGDKVVLMSNSWHGTRT